MNDLTPNRLASLLAEKADEFVAWLLPNGVREGPDWIVGSVAGEAGKSLKICLDGEKRGRWADFAADGHHGDLIDLLAQHRGTNIGAAMAEAAAWLGIERAEWREHKKAELREIDPPKQARAISQSPKVAAWLAARKITQDTAQKYMLLADGPGTIVFPSLIGDKVVHLKYRAVDQKKFWSSADSAKVLFGWHALKPGARAVILTEGEMDALAFAEYGFQALSIPYGAGKGKKLEWIENDWDRLERFDTIFVALDWDKVGQQAVQEVVDRLGRTRCRVLKLAGKDANQMLMDGVPKEHMLKLIREAKTLDPQELRNSGEFKDEVIDRFYPSSPEAVGFKLPWAALADKFTMEYGATTVLAGYSSHGKSQVAGQIVLSAMQQGVRACVWSGEFRTSKWLQRLTRQATSVPIPSRDDIGRAFDWFAENIWAIDVYGDKKIDRMLDVFAYAARRYGIRLMVLDNFSKLGLADDDLAGQKRAIVAITEFAVTHNVHFIVVHHVRKEETDFGSGNLSKLSLKGSSTLGDLPDNVYLVWRNRSKEQKMADPKFLELEEEEQDEIRGQCDTLLRCEKHRNGDEEPRLPLWFERDSQTWTQKPAAPPIRYLRISA